MTLDELRASTAAVLTITEVASLLGIDERTVSRALEAGQLPLLEVSRRRLIPREPLLALLSAPNVMVPTPATGTGTIDEVPASPTDHETPEVPRAKTVAPDGRPEQRPRARAS